MDSDLFDYYDYSPERWIILRVDSKEGLPTHYRVFGTWGGSYLGGQEWKLNSGITSVVENTNYFYFKGVSGSVYRCHKKSYGTFSYGEMVLQNIKKNSKEIEITEMPEDTDWLLIQYN